MPTTLTLKNVPDDVYARLKAAAERNRRSLNSEAIVCLESVLTPAEASPAERLDRIRKLRAQMAHVWITDDEVTQAKRAGRP